MLSLKNGGKIRPHFNVCCFSYHFTTPSSTNLPGYSASLSRVNTCWAVNIVRPLSRLRQQVLKDDSFLILGQAQSRSRCPRPHKVQAQVTGSHNLSLFFLRLPPSLYLSPSPGILIWLCRLCHCTHSAPSSSLGPRLRFN